MMKNIKLLFLLSAVWVLTGCAGSASQDSEEQEEVQELKYPETAKDPTIDNYFGTEVADPYRWLENDTTAAVAEWVAAQNEVTFDYLDKIPYRDDIRERLTELYNYERISSPSREGGDHYFFYKNDGLQDQSVIYIQDGLDGEPKEYLDPNKFSQGGTVSIGSFTVSNDGKYVAYSTQSSGSDWNTIYVMELKSKKMIDTLEWVKFSSPQWYKEGFFYSRFPQPDAAAYSSQNKDQKVYYHKIGDPQSKDKMIYADPENALHYVFSNVDEKADMLALTNEAGTSGNSLYFKDLRKGMDAPMIPVVTGHENENYFVDALNGKALVKTNIDAPNFRLVAVDLNNPQKENWKDILPNKNDMTLQSVDVASGRIIATYMKDASSRLVIFDATGKQIEEVTLPAIGSVDGINTGKDDSIFFYRFSSFIYPHTIYKYNLNNNENDLHFQPQLNFDPEDFETKQEWFTSKDGTKVPMFIVHKKGLKKDGMNPAFLYGYGGFNISLTPSFSPTRMLLLENGFVYAQPTLRGGGEYGEEWHKKGMLLQKQNVFDDFISAGEYLISQKYTDSSKLAIAGRSNGGLLVGAAMTQRPDLFAVALPGVGVMDMLRFHKFTVGHGWVVEYGSSDDPAGFNNLYAYSPLHNLKEGTSYPATLVTTADHDDRVVPAHSFKYIATLQEKHRGPQPVMIRIDTKAGHGAGKPVSMIIDETADVYAFTFENLNVKPVSQ